MISYKAFAGLHKTVLVTDSGLGGLSVFAQIAARLAISSPWKNVSMVYFNSWPEKDRGYNHFETMDQRAKVFNNALNTMEKFNPDMILIACNTLSVIYPFTQYSLDTGIPVTGIVNHGVHLIHDHLHADPGSLVIIFGTPTTIAENSHQKALLKMGIAQDRIICQGCKDLAGKIERNPFSDQVEKMIHTNAAKAVSKIKQPFKKIYAALCCTHFGYCHDLFNKALSGLIKEKVAVLNPNQRMADHMMEDPAFKDLSLTGGFVPDIDMHIVSRVFWEPERIDAYVKLLENISLETVRALADYQWNPDLFEI